MSQSNLSYINTTLQAALNATSGLFTSKTAPAKVKKELDDLSNNLASLAALVMDDADGKRELSWIGATTVSIPKGVSVGVSFSRTTSTIKHLSAPISSADATAILDSYRMLQMRTLAFLAIFKQGAPFWEKLAPGIRDFGLKTLKQLFDSLSNALANADTTSIPPATVREIQASVTSTIQSLSA